MQAVGNAGALSRLVRLQQVPARLAAAQRVLTTLEGASFPVTCYLGYIRNPLPNPVSLSAQRAHPWDEDRVYSFFNPVLNPAPFSTQTYRKKSVLHSSIKAAVSSRPKPSSKPATKPAGKPSSKPNPKPTGETLTPKREPAPWLVAREEIRRQAETDKKTRKQERSDRASEKDVDIFGVPLGETSDQKDGLVRDHEPAGLKLKSAEFVISSTDVSKCPDTNMVEFAVVGRSNVGKSSLINMLTNRKSLAMTSKRPGKTQTINHYLINNDWYLVDLPGYGYAAAPGKARDAWNEFTKDYFLNRKQLVTVLLLVDASIPPQEIDLECVEWLAENQVPVSLVFTKCEKRKKTKVGGKHPLENIADFESMLEATWDEPPIKILTSSVTGMGRNELLSHLSQLRRFWKDKG